MLVVDGKTAHKNWKKSVQYLNYDLVDRTNVKIISKVQQYTSDILAIRGFQYYLRHCPKYSPNLRIKTIPNTAGADAMEHLWHLYTYSTVLYCTVLYSISGPLTRHKPCHLLEPCEARFLWKDSDYFWDSASVSYSFMLRIYILQCIVMRLSRSLSIFLDKQN